MINFFEKLFFAPKFYHYFISILLLPFSLIYATTIFFKNIFTKSKDYGIKIISIGNLTVGGTGKTPFAISLINTIKDKKICYISRGYGRESRGLIEVKINNKILVDVRESGDEAMLVANECNCDVIVSEDRVKAILRAKELGANLIILDDGFSKKFIKKFDILLEAKEIKNYFPLPSGPFREFYFAKKRANLVLKEDIDFKRDVECINCDEKMLLVTAISNPKRLKAYLPKNVIGEYILADHAYFEKEKILEKMKRFGVNKILVTQKDYVKLKNFKLDIALLKLKLYINSNILNEIERYINEE